MVLLAVRSKKLRRIAAFQQTDDAACIRVVREVRERGWHHCCTQAAIQDTLQHRQRIPAMSPIGVTQAEPQSASITRKWNVGTLTTCCMHTGDVSGSSSPLPRSHRVSVKHCQSADNCVQVSSANARYMHRLAHDKPQSVRGYWEILPETPDCQRCAGFHPNP